MSVILSSRRSQDTNPRHHAWRRRINRFCDAIVCVSEETAGHAVRNESVPTRKVITVPNGVSIPEVEAPHGSSARVKFGTLGNVKPVKGTDMLVEAFLVSSERRY